MPLFSSPNTFKDLKTYVPLLKKALSTVKPDAKRKFLYYRQYPFGTKKLPLILVDFDAKCQEALAKTGLKPAAEGVVSLTEKDELDFDSMKGQLKRAAIKKHFATLGTGIKPVFVPDGETDDDESTLSMPQLPTPPNAQKATGTATQPSGTPPPKKESFDDEMARRNLLSRIDQLRAGQFAPKDDGLKSMALDKAKSLVEANKFYEATQLLDQLAAKAISSSGAPASSAAPGAAKPSASISALKWDLWFQETPAWPVSLTRAEWSKNKGTMAKLALSTGIGDQLNACEAAFQAAVSQMPSITSDSQANFPEVVKQCQAFMKGSEMGALQSSLKKLEGLAGKAAIECQKSKVIPKETLQLCSGIAKLAGELGNATNLNSCLASAIKAEQALLQVDKQWGIDALKAEKDVQKRIAACNKLLKEHPELSRQREKVEDILADALKEQGVAQAQAAYTAQAKGGSGAFDLKNLKEKDRILKDTFFKDKKVQDFMKNTGLTEGEVVAIRAYTAKNYKYINPAIANQKDRADKTSDWMDQNRPDPNQGSSAKRKAELAAKLQTYETGSKTDAGSKKGLYEEGALHAGMIAEAFKKLPKKKGKLYRGTRMTAKAFRKAYAPGKVFTYEAFASQSTSEEVARTFANGAGEDKPPDDATTSVFIEAFITDARDLQALSVMGDGEAEWLLPPGTKLRVDSVEDDTTQDEGEPSATEWKKVTLIQVT